MRASESDREREEGAGGERGPCHVQEHAGGVSKLLKVVALHPRPRRQREDLLRHSDCGREAEAAAAEKIL